MKKSDNIAALAAALTKAQAQMSGAKKSSKNPFFKSTYASLEEVIHCVKDAFADNDLSFVQFPVSEDGRAGVETIILHSSGEWISNEYTLPVVKDDPQGMGSAITYARRYGLQAAAGVPSEDDDGNAACQPPKKESKPPAASKAQLENIGTLSKKAELSDEQMVKAITWASGGEAENVEHLTAPAAAKLIKFITDKIQTTKTAAA